MTVSSTTSRNQYTATSGQTVFPYTFEIFDKDDVAVLQNGTLLSEGTNYTVSGVGNNSGGNITLVVGATAGDVLTIYRDMAYQRLTDYQNSGDFLAQEVNDDFDRLWLAVQQNEQGTDRAIVKPITDASSIDMTLPSAADRANSYLTFDATGAPSVVAAGDPSAPDAITRQDFTGDGSTVIYTLASAPGAAGAGVMIFIDGIQQDKDSYTITGTTLTFSEAPPLNSNINLVQLKATDIGEADSASVTYIPAGTGAVQTSVQSKLRETVSVRDFGAVGDGVTDDTAAIQAAIDAIANGVVFFPVGTYKIGSQIDINTGVSLMGYGATLSITTAASSFVYGASSIAESHVVAGFKVVGNGTTTLTRAVFHTVSGAQIDTVVFKDLYFDSVSFGIYINHESSGNNANAKVIGCSFVNIFDDSDGVTSGRGVGVAFSGGNTAGRPPLRASVVGCSFTNTGRHAVYISSGSNLTVTGCNFYEHRTGATIQSYPLPALNISRANNVTVTGNNFVGCNDTCIAVQNGSPSGSCFNNTISGNTFSDYSTYGIRVGTDSPDINGLVSDIILASNNFYHKSTNTYPALIILHGKNIKVTGNIIDASNLTVDHNSIISLYGYGSTNPSDNYHITNNTIMMAISGVATAKAITIQSNICSGSQMVIIKDNIIEALANLYFTAGITNSNLIYSDNFAVTRSANLVISGGAITVTGNRHFVDTEGAAATDDLDTINGGQDGQILVLSTVTSGRDITVKDSTGNIRLAGDFALSTTQDTIVLMYDSVSSFWLELSRSDNA